LSPTARWLGERRGIPVELVGGLSRKPEHFLRDSAQLDLSRVVAQPVLLNARK
jgi:hypothetical protein